MIGFDLQVTYRDGTVAEVACDQYCLGVWERWAAKNGLRNDPEHPAALAWTQLRVMAWATLQRDAKAKAAFEAWDPTVASVERAGGDREQPDPTAPATSAG